MKNLLYLFLFTIILAACARKADDPAPASSRGCNAPPSGMPASISYVDNLNARNFTLELCYDNLGRISKAYTGIGADSSTIIASYGLNGKLASLVFITKRGNVRSTGRPTLYRWIGNELRSSIRQDTVSTNGRKYLTTLRNFYSYLPNGNLNNFIFWNDSSTATSTFPNSGLKFLYQPGSSVPYHADRVTSVDSGINTTIIPWPIQTSFYNYDQSNRLVTRGGKNYSDTTRLEYFTYDNFTYNTFPTEFIMAVSNREYIKNYDIYQTWKPDTDPDGFLSLDPGIATYTKYDGSNLCYYTSAKYLNKTKNASGNLSSFRYVLSEKYCASPEFKVFDYTVDINY